MEELVVKYVLDDTCSITVTQGEDTVSSTWESNRGVEDEKLVLPSGVEIEIYYQADIQPVAILGVCGKEGTSATLEAEFTLDGHIVCAVKDNSSDMYKEPIVQEFFRKGGSFSKMFTL